MTKETIFILLGFGLMVFAFWFAIAYGSNSTSNMTLDCIRMFYSDEWNKGYVIDLEKFCNDR